MKKSQSKKGFTLIEVLIVVGIIGILSSVILVGLNSSRSRARDTRRVTDLRQTQQALELFYTKTGCYPNAGSWDALETDLVSEDIGVRQIARDPGELSYEYGASGSCPQDYILKAELENENASIQADSIVDNIGGVGCGANEQAFCVAP